MKSEAKKMRLQNTDRFPLKSILCGMALFIIGAPAYSASLFYDSFESGDLLHAENGYRWNGANSGSGDANPAVTTAIARSGTRSVKFTFGGGNILDDAWSELRYILGRNMNEVYMQFYQYYPSGTEVPSVGPKWVHRVVSPANNKFFKLWADNYSNYTIATGISTNPTPDGHDIFFVEYGTNQLAGGVDGHGAKPNFIANDSHLGRWLKIQIHIKCATAANNDGVEEMWVDDARVMSNTNLPLYPAGGVGNYLRNGYLMGWMNSGFDLTSYTYIDDVTISDTYITSTPPPTLTLSASPASVAYNGSSTLTWSSSNATACAASGAWSGVKAPSGAVTLPALTTTAAYTLTCTGAGGSTGQSATIAVAPPI